MGSTFVLLFAILALLSLVLHSLYVHARLGIRDIPNARSLHTEITKKSGGLVFIPMFLLLLLLWEYQPLSSLLASVHLPAHSSLILFLIYGSLFFCMLGFLDDVYSLSPNVRLLLEFSFSFLWIYFLAPNIHIFGLTFLNPWLNLLVMGFFIVFIVNLVNFMDGLDSYLIGTIFISLLFWIPNFHQFLPGSTYFFIILLLLVSIFGFSFYNFPKAKLFMGDSGSLGLGFFLIALPLLASKENSESFEVMKLFLLFPVFWIDGLLTLVIRSFQDKHVFSAHKEHLYQILTTTKLGKSGTCLVVCLANLPAYITYTLFSLKLIQFEVSSDQLILLIALIYAGFYSFLRFAIYQSRKNLA